MIGNLSVAVYIFFMVDLDKNKCKLLDYIWDE